MRTRYTQNEETTICHIYAHTNCSRTSRAIIAEAMLGTSHSLASYAAQFGRLEALDIRIPTATNFGMSKSLVATATEFAPHIFLAV